jgi:hypothetical protein
VLSMLAACGSEEATGVQGVAVDEFESFSWSFVGTGVGRSFALDRDCGVSATQFLPPVKGSGLVAPFDCDAFKSLVVSPDVVAALRGSVDCPFASDDMESMSLQTTDDAGISRSTTGCSNVDPLSRVYVAMDQLTGKYVAFRRDDTGVDVVDAGGD